nr:MAG TPA: hypothetical protein [Caudoviricetes sp.]
MNLVFIGIKVKRAGGRVLGSIPKAALTIIRKRNGSNI